MAKKDRTRKRPKLSFNAYNKYRGPVGRTINADYKRWHEWLGVLAGRRHSAQVWSNLWEIFIETQDDKT